jgi:hypothetical protein
MSCGGGAPSSKIHIKFTSEVDYELNNFDYFCTENNEVPIE